jgi:hypothetical protein
MMAVSEQGLFFPRFTVVLIRTKDAKRQRIPPHLNPLPEGRGGITMPRLVRDLLVV